MNDDWRLTVWVTHADALSKEELEAVLPAGLRGTLDYTNTASTLHVYADEEPTILRALESVLDAIGRLGAEGASVVECWNPRSTEWQDPSLPVFGPPLSPESVDFDSIEYAVVIRSPGAVKDVEAALQGDGIAAFARGKRKLWVGRARERRRASSTAFARRRRRAAGSSCAGSRDCGARFSRRSSWATTCPVPALRARSRQIQGQAPSFSTTGLHRWVDR